MSDKGCDFEYLNGACGLPPVMRFRHDESGWFYRCADHAAFMRKELYVIEPIPSTPIERTISAADIEQLVADAEIKLDDLFADEHDVLTDLLARLRSIAGLDSLEYDAPVLPLTIGRRDECLISVPHSHEFCGKPEAHR